MAWHLKEAMQLARHSDPKLTMAVYGCAQLYELGSKDSIGSKNRVREPRQKAK
jgi:hypothetical protein